jgi:hypothetical protein
MRNARAPRGRMMRSVVVCLCHRIFSFLDVCHVLGLSSLMSRLRSLAIFALACKGGLADAPLLRRLSQGQGHGVAVPQGTNPCTCQQRPETVCIPAVCQWTIFFLVSDTVAQYTKPACLARNSHENTRHAGHPRALGTRISDGAKNNDPWYLWVTTWTNDRPRAKKTQASRLNILTRSSNHK